MDKEKFNLDRYFKEFVDQNEKSTGGLPIPPRVVHIMESSFYSGNAVFFYNIIFQLEKLSMAERGEAYSYMNDQLEKKRKASVDLKRQHDNN